MSNYNYGRTGWNRRGPTDKQLLAEARRQSEEINNPNSYFWENATYNLKLALAEKMGADEFTAFAELVFPGETIDDYSWKQIHDTYAAKLERLQAEDLNAEARRWMNDPRHYKTNGEF